MLTSTAHAEGVVRIGPDFLGSSQNLNLVISLYAYLTAQSSISILELVLSTLGRLMCTVARGKNPHAIALGQLGGKASIGALSKEQRKSLARSGGLVGGKARAAKLTAARRREIAKAAAAARWSNQKSDRKTAE